MNDIEEITGEMRRLALRCKALEAKLADSVPKKTYNDAVAKLQSVIDSGAAELQRTKEALEKTETLGGRLNTLTNQITLLAEASSSQQTAIKSLETKFGESTVPEEIYNQTVAECRKLEEEIKLMIPRSEFDTLLQKNVELEQRIATMVPEEEHRKSVERISELESVMANLVPRADLEELTDQVKSIASSVTIVPQELPPIETIAEASMPEVASSNSESIETAPTFQAE
ncbi:MAG: hypothetical protein JRN52_15025 [Nitrososphaerota archaeon]|nr:hypothetical protein [Nitrososphaerota archaeon]